MGRAAAGLCGGFSGRHCPVRRRVEEAGGALCQRFGGRMSPGAASLARPAAAAAGESRRRLALALVPRRQMEQAAEPSWAVLSEEPDRPAPLADEIVPA